jgi:hypothetical protein
VNDKTVYSAGYSAASVLCFCSAAGALAVAFCYFIFIYLFIFGLRLDGVLVVFHNDRGV